MKQKGLTQTLYTSEFPSLIFIYISQNCLYGALNKKTQIL